MKDSLFPGRRPPPTRLPYDASDVLVSVDVALEEIRAGRMVILVDDEDRENEGDLCMAAEKCTGEAINFMATHGRGLICLPMTEERLRQLRLSMMVPDAENNSSFGTAFTVSIEARERALRPESPRRIAPPPSRSPSPTMPDPRTSCVLGTSSPFGLGTAGCSAVPVRRRDPWTWPGWRA